MIKATIVTIYRRYDLEVPAENGTDVQTAHKWLRDQIDHDEGIIELPGRIIDVESVDVRSIEVWQESVQSPIGGLATLSSIGANISDEEPGEYTGEVEYLGQRVRIRHITYRLRGFYYVLPHEINGGAALELIDGGRLGQLSEQLLQREGINATVLVPPVQLPNDKEAQEYVMDYAEQATPQPVSMERTAAAFWGMRNDNK